MVSPELSFSAALARGPKDFVTISKHRVKQFSRSTPFEHPLAKLVRKTLSDIYDTHFSVGSIVVDETSYEVTLKDGSIPLGYVTYDDCAENIVPLGNDDCAAFLQINNSFRPSFINNDDSVDDDDQADDSNDDDDSVDDDDQADDSNDDVVNDSLCEDTQHVVLSESLDFKGKVRTRVQTPVIPNDSVLDERSRKFEDELRKLRAMVRNFEEDLDELPSLHKKLRDVYEIMVVSLSKYFNCETTFIHGINLACEDGCYTMNINHEIDDPECHEFDLTVGATIVVRLEQRSLGTDASSMVLNEDRDEIFIKPVFYFADVEGERLTDFISKCMRFQDLKGQEDLLLEGLKQGTMQLDDCQRMYDDYRESIDWKNTTYVSKDAELLRLFRQFNYSNVNTGFLFVTIHTLINRIHLNTWFNIPVSKSIGMIKHYVGVTLLTKWSDFSEILRNQLHDVKVTQKRDGDLLIDDFHVKDFEKEFGKYQFGKYQHDDPDHFRSIDHYASLVLALETYARECVIMKKKRRVTASVTIKRFVMRHTENHSFRPVDIQSEIDLTLNDLQTKVWPLMFIILLSNINSSIITFFHNKSSFKQKNLIELCGDVLRKDSNNGLNKWYALMMMVYQEMFDGYYNPSVTTLGTFSTGIFNICTATNSHFNIFSKYVKVADELKWTLKDSSRPSSVSVLNALIDLLNDPTSELSETLSSSNVKRHTERFKTDVATIKREIRDHDRAFQISCGLVNQQRRRAKAMISFGSNRTKAQGRTDLRTIDRQIAESRAIYDRNHEELVANVRTRVAQLQSRYDTEHQTLLFQERQRLSDNFSVNLFIFLGQHVFAKNFFQNISGPPQIKHHKASMMMQILQDHFDTEHLCLRTDCKVELISNITRDLVSDDNGSLKRELNPVFNELCRHIDFSIFKKFFETCYGCKSNVAKMVAKSITSVIERDIYDDLVQKTSVILGQQRQTINDIVGDAQFTIRSSQQKKSKKRRSSRDTVTPSYCLDAPETTPEAKQQKQALVKRLNEEYTAEIEESERQEQLADSDVDDQTDYVDREAIMPSMYRRKTSDNNVCLDYIPWGTVLSDSPREIIN